MNYIDCMWNKLVKVTNKVLPELLNAKIGESLGLVLSRDVEAYDEIQLTEVPRDHNMSTSDHRRATKVDCNFLLM